MTRYHARLDGPPVYAQHAAMHRECGGKLGWVKASGKQGPDVDGEIEPCECPSRCVCEEAR